MKASKIAALYVPHVTKGPKCRECEYFQGPSSCTKVTGDISPSGYCDKYFEPIKRGKK